MSNTASPADLSRPSRPASTLPLAVGAVAFTVLAWASSFPVIRIGLNDLAPLPLAAARYAVAAVLVLAWIAWKRPKRPTLPHAIRFMLCGAIGISLYNTFLNTGQQTVSAGAASFIVNTEPIFAAILAFLFLRERFTVWGWLGTFISFAGVVLIASGQPGGLQFGAGASLILGAAVATATYFVLKWPLISIYGPLACTAYTLLSGALLLSPWLGEGVMRLASPDVAPITLPAVILLGVFPAALGYATWTYALGHFGAARASNFLYLVPPVATALAFLITGEVPGSTTILGGLIAIGGVVLVNTRGKSR